MSGDRVDALLLEYQKQLRLPWMTSIAGAQKVWMLIYPPNLERRIRAKLEDFKTETIAAGYQWSILDLSSAFSTWFAKNEYREAYFAEPDLASAAMGDFVQAVVETVRDRLSSPEVDDQTVVALLGCGALFPMARVSQIVEKVTPAIRGRLLVFFPGQREGSNYRLLDARDGWDYLAVPIE